MIYFDNAATSFPKPAAVIEAVAEAARSFGNPSRSAHLPALTAGRAVEQTRDLAARLFGCRRTERVVFTKNVTEALNLAIASVAGHLITTEAEHNSVLRPVVRHGNFSIVEVDGRGLYGVEALARALRPDSAALVLGHASNLTGNLAPVAEAGRLCRERGLIFILDAAQTAGVADLDMETLGVDALCFTGHKSLYGLQGAGGLCLSERFTPRPLIVGGSGSRSFDLEQPADLPDLLEAGTLNGHGLAALGAGLKYVLEQSPARLWAEADRLARMFYEGLRDVSGLRFYGDHDATPRAPIVALNVGERPSGELAMELFDKYGIAVRAGAHCAPLLHRRFGTEEQGALRFSFSHFNTKEEIALGIEAVKEISRD